MYKLAKNVLSDWWNEEYYFGIVPIRIDQEKVLSQNGYIQFTPDLIIYDITGIRAFAEVVYSNPVHPLKMWKIWWWCDLHHIKPLVIEVDATWIMRQTVAPDKLPCKIISNRFINYEIDSFITK
jgi:hypothetical protein